MADRQRGRDFPADLPPPPLAPSSSSGTCHPPNIAAACATLPTTSTPAKFSIAFPDSNNESSEIKARILAQQREVMLRRRQEGMRAEAVRSVEDPSSSSSSAAASAYHTPGIKQFSTPQTVEGESQANQNAAKQSKRVVPMPQGPPPTSASRRIYSYRANISSSSSFDNKKEAAPSKPPFKPTREPLAIASLNVNDESESSDSEGDDDDSPAGNSKISLPSSLSLKNDDDSGVDDSISVNSALVFQASESIRKPLDISTLLATRTDVRRFVTHPVPRTAGVVHCYIKRSKAGTGKLYPEYRLYTRQGSHFLMAAKKQANNKTSNYHVTLNDRDFAKESPDYLGKLRANFVGTEFQIFDRGSKASIDSKDVDGAGLLGSNSGPSNASTPREELGVVVYAANVLGARGPRKMQAFLPRVSKVDDRVVDWKDEEDLTDQDAMLERVRRGDTAKFHHFINKPPRWNDQVGAYVLNFMGRVTMASVKNFQLIEPEDHEVVVLQFGRVGKHDFTMDVRWPFTPLQALAVALSSFDSKIACD
jgi:hypothetical protein